MEGAEGVEAVTPWMVRFDGVDLSEAMQIEAETPQEAAEKFGCVYASIRSPGLLKGVLVLVRSGKGDIRFRVQAVMQVAVRARLEED